MEVLGSINDAVVVEVPDNWDTSEQRRIEKIAENLGMPVIYLRASPITELFRIITGQEVQRNG